MPAPPTTFIPALVGLHILLLVIVWPSAVFRSTATQTSSLCQTLSPSFCPSNSTPTVYLQLDQVQICSINHTTGISPVLNVHVASNCWNYYAQTLVICDQLFSYIVNLKVLLCVKADFRDY